MSSKTILLFHTYVLPSQPLRHFPIIKVEKIPKHKCNMSVAHCHSGTNPPTGPERDQFEILSFVVHGLVLEPLGIELVGILPRPFVAVDGASVNEDCGVGTDVVAVELEVVGVAVWDEEHDRWV